ncbi:helix-turn-helix domain-containing protein [Endozoicomonas atrinae]|uniref:LexA family transcriptional regulator n=1 Tax=Endozoicomonas atrinae TaxID=1333660 RepID=UPI003B00D81F
MLDWRDRIKFLLQKKNMTQGDLAKALGVADPTVSIWLKGKVRLSDENTTKIQYQVASALEVDPEFIITGDGAPSPELTIGTPAPLLTRTEISHWILSGTTAKTTRWMSFPIEAGERTFCYRMEGSSMDCSALPSAVNFPDSSLVFIDPSKPLELGKPCLFQDNSPVLGIYEELNDRSMLLFNNPRLSAINVVRDNYIGRAIGCFMSSG